MFLWSHFKDDLDVKVDLADDGCFNVPFFFLRILGRSNIILWKRSWEDSGCLEFSGSDLFFCWGFSKVCMCAFRDSNEQLLGRGLDLAIFCRNQHCNLRDVNNSSPCVLLLGIWFMWAKLIHLQLQSATPVSMLRTQGTYIHKTQERKHHIHG